VIEEVGVKSRAGSEALEQIEQLELRIEELREAIQRSQRLILAVRACAIIGPTLLVCLLLGLLRFTPSEMIIGIALVAGLDPYRFPGLRIAAIRASRLFT
jgi:hypothetical protein